MKKFIQKQVTINEEILICNRCKKELGEHEFLRRCCFCNEEVCFTRSLHKQINNCGYKDYDNDSDYPSYYCEACRPYVSMYKSKLETFKKRHDAEVDELKKAYIQAAKEAGKKDIK